MLKDNEMKNGLIEYSNGSKEWLKEGKLHRLDGPAVIYSNGTKKWFKEDKLHRLDGPAIEFSDGIKQWFIEGKLVYSENADNTCRFELSDIMKKSIIKYKLERM